MSGNRGNWIRLASGRRFYLTDPRPEDIDIEDIAPALAKMCRFNGQCPRFYSVAEHSWHVAMALLEMTWDRELALAGLLHDATEAYLPDVTRPLKALLPEFTAIERRVAAAVAERFALDPDTRGLVRLTDLRMLATEARGFGWDIAHWDSATRDACTVNRRVEFLDPNRAEIDFRGCFDLLTAARGKSAKGKTARDGLG